MQVSNYFHGALNAYAAEIDDLSSNGGKASLEKCIADKIKALSVLMKLADEFPIMVAPIFRGAIKFTELSNVKALVKQDSDDFPTWDSLKESVIFADQELVEQVLKYKNGEFLLTFSVAMEFLFTQKPAATKKKVTKDNGNPDVDGDWSENEAPNLTGLDNIDSSEWYVMSTDLVISEIAALAISCAFNAAESSLVAFAEEHGDQQLRVLMGEMEPKHLGAIVRQFDCSKSSPISMLVSEEQFLAMLVHERSYNELDKLEALMNSVVMARDEPERYDFLAAISEAGCEDILATYLLGSDGQNHEVLAHFHRYGTFNLGWDGPDSHAEALDGEWKQFAFELRENFPDCWDAVYECVQRTYTKNKAAQNEQEDRLIAEFDAIEHKNQGPIIAEQADENSAL